MAIKIGERTIIGFDFGTKYIGVAVGQELTRTASPLGSIKAKDGIPNQEQLKKILYGMATKFNCSWPTIEYGWHKSKRYFCGKEIWK